VLPNSAGEADVAARLNSSRYADNRVTPPEQGTSQNYLVQASAATASVLNPDNARDIARRTCAAVPLAANCCDKLLPDRRRALPWRVCCATRYDTV
jgi:hypothetical protein